MNSDSRPTTEESFLQENKSKLIFAGILWGVVLIALIAQ